MTRRSLTVACVVLAMAGVVPPAVVNVSAATVTEDNQVPIGNHPDDGSLHIIADDSLEREVADPPSILYPTDAPQGGLIACTSATDTGCAGKSSLQYIAHLPTCNTDITVDCISAVSAAKANGRDQAGTFSSYFPNQGPHSYTGDPELKLPSGRAPSVWSLPNAEHTGGTDYAVVARLRGSTTNRSAASFQLTLTPVSLKTNADPHGGYQPPRYVENGRISGPAADRGNYRCAFWGSDASCLLSRDFPRNYTYTVSVRLAVEPAGWLHGRIDSPDITFTKDGSVTVVTVTAKPVQVPAFQVAKQSSAYPQNVQTAFALGGPYGEGGSRRPGGQYDTNPATRNAEYTILSYSTEGFDQLELMEPVIEDKATYAPWLWRVRTLDEREMTNAGACLKTGEGVKGMVTTNALVYGNGPPLYNSGTSTLDYKVAAPHLMADGSVFSGNYTMIMKSSVARCIYNFTSSPIKGQISVVKANGSKGEATTSVSEKNGWLTFTATGFTHSAPTVKVQMTQDPEPTTTTSTTIAPSTTVAPSVPATTAAPSTTSSTTTTTVAPGVVTKRGKTVAGTLLARSLGLVVSRTSTVKLARTAKLARQCVVVGSRVRALKSGSCVVRVTVTTGKKSVSRSITLTVA